MHVLLVDTDSAFYVFIGFYINYNFHKNCFIILKALLNAMST